MSAVNRVLKVVVGAAFLVAALAVLGLGWVAWSWPPTHPDVPIPQVEASEDPEVIERGAYLFHAVAHCTACHMPTDEWLALEAGAKGVPAGDRVWELGPLGTLRTPNLTPDSATGVGAWTDGELARVMEHSVLPNDEPALMMNSAGAMGEEDLRALISYMRAMEPVERAREPRRDLSLLGRLFLLTELRLFASPRPEALRAPDGPPPGEDVSRRRGEYLARGPAACAFCHTPVDPASGELEGPLFSGGDPMPDVLDPEMEFIGPNLTPGGALAGWGEDDFVEAFRAGRRFEGSPMPWQNYAGMTEEDLRSIYRYLESLEPSGRDPGPIHRKAGWEAGEGS